MTFLVVRYSEHTADPVGSLDDAAKKIRLHGGSLWQVCNDHATPQALPGSIFDNGSYYAPAPEALRQQLKDLLAITPAPAPKATPAPKAPPAPKASPTPTPFRLPTVEDITRPMTASQVAGLCGATSDEDQFALTRRLQSLVFKKLLKQDRRGFFTRS